MDGSTILEAHASERLPSTPGPTRGQRAPLQSRAAAHLGLRRLEQPFLHLQPPLERPLLLGERHSLLLGRLPDLCLQGGDLLGPARQQAERYGTPLAQTLRVLAQENRDMRMSEAEKKAAALPPKLTVPMILFFLPVLFIVILGPAAIRVMALQ